MITIDSNYSDGDLIFLDEDEAVNVLVTPSSDDVNHSDFTFEWFNITTGDSAGTSDSIEILPTESEDSVTYECNVTDLDSSGSVLGGTTFTVHVQINKLNDRLPSEHRRMRLLGYI